MWSLTSLIKSYMKNQCMTCVCVIYEVDYTNTLNEL